MTWVHLDVLFFTVAGIGFVVWLFYRSMIKDDLEQYAEEARAVAFFLGVAALVYWSILR
ncbi:MAG TPA: hypothetical protein VHL57_02465 [Flavobacteriales bacterium]|jgi:hypothetical protein|nr:hypothetical protein [Flavobacteriales bacterium]